MQRTQRKTLETLCPLRLCDLCVKYLVIFKSSVFLALNSHLRVKSPCFHAYAGWGLSNENPTQGRAERTKVLRTTSKREIKPQML